MKKTLKKFNKKVNKKINKNVSNIIRSQNGGVLFDIHYDQLEELVHIGEKDSLGNELSCGACALNQLNFPIDIVDELSTIANSSGKVLYKTMLEKINQINPQGPPADIYIWGLNNKSKVHLTNYDIPYNQWPLGIDSIKNTKSVLKAIFQTLNKGSATVLGIIWQEGIGGHYTVIAKSEEDTPYIIETQNTENYNYQGVYRGMKQIINHYFNNPQVKQIQVEYFITFNNSKPKYDDVNKTWTLDNEPVINLLPKKDSTNSIRRYPIYADRERSLRILPPASGQLQRYSSFTTPTITNSSHPISHYQDTIGGNKSIKKRKSRKKYKSIKKKKV